MRKRVVYRLTTKFTCASPNTREITTDILEELKNDNSRSSIVVDSFGDKGNIYIYIYIYMIDRDNSLFPWCNSYSKQTNKNFFIEIIYIYILFNRIFLEDLLFLLEDFLKISDQVCRNFYYY